MGGCPILRLEQENIRYKLAGQEGLVVPQVKNLEHPSGKSRK